MPFIIKNWLIHHLKFNKLLFKRINKIESFFNSGNFEEEKNKKFITFLHDTYKNNSFYNSFYKNSGFDLTTIKNYKDAYKLPILTKDLIKNNFKHIKKKGKIYFKGYTSGTSGTPLVIYRTIDSIINENAYVWWYRMQSGLNYGEKIISLRGDLDKNKIIHFDKYSNTLHISSFNLNKKNILDIFKKIEAFKPKAIIGYPSSINTLANLMNSQNVQIEIPLTFTSSETLYNFQQINIKKAFKTIIFDWYGNSERTIALYKKDNLYFEPPMYSINCYLKGKVLTTSLINQDFPLINYKIDDLIETDKKYDNSKLSLIINKIDGRKDDYIELYDGSKIGTAALSLMFKNLDILLSQIVYFDKGVFDINLVPGKTFNNNSLKKLKNLIYCRLGVENKISINIVSDNKIIYNKSGKFLFIVNKKL